jgi:hypothetical protein
MGRCARGLLGGTPGRFSGVSLWHATKQRSRQVRQGRIGGFLDGPELIRVARELPGSQDLGWAEGWGLVRQVHEKLEFVAFFDLREDAEAAAAEAGVDCQVCRLTYKDGLDVPPEKNATRVVTPERIDGCTED